MKSLNGKILIDIDLFERVVRPALEIERKKLEIELAKTILLATIYNLGQEGK